MTALVATGDPALTAEEASEAIIQWSYVLPAHTDALVIAVHEHDVREIR